jgi:hypothetical protein
MRLRCFLSQLITGIGMPDNAHPGVITQYAAQPGSPMPTPPPW